MKFQEDSISDIIKDYQDILQLDNQVNNEIKIVNQKVDKQIEICDNTDIILENATTEFEKLTSIFNKKDLTFFVFSLILQGAVKYAMKVMREMSDKELADKTPFHKKEKSNRNNEDYYCSREEIITNPVPFDAIKLLSF